MSKTWAARGIAAAAVILGGVSPAVANEPPPDPSAEPPAQPPRTPARHVYLNGQSIDDIRGVTLIDMTIEIAPDGSIHLSNPGYMVQRRPGMQAQIVRKTVVPLDQTAYLVSEVTARGALPFAVKVWIGDRLAATIDGVESRQTVDVTPFLIKGINPVRLEVVDQSRPGTRPDPHAKVEITVGLGTMKKRLLAIDRVLMSWERLATEAGRRNEQRTIDLSE